jgi:nitroimidazol reductase NimA-like FMN-containing flavoprotein (pyridoxamine 5'-phosphate oxidase superfamily)
MSQRKLQPLTDDECFALLHEGHVGRLVYQDDLGPIAVPVNYAVADRSIVIRIEGGAKLAAVAQPRIAFEVDHIDEDERSGWSVIVRGPGREVPLEQQPDLVHRMDGDAPMPWASGIHNTWVEVAAEIVTGRRFGDHEASLIV